MAPEYEKAALGLYPFVPSYAVNCDDEGNKDMCREQNVETFPTTKARHFLPFGSFLLESDDTLAISAR